MTSNNLGTLAAIGGITGALITVVVFVTSRKQRKLQTEVLALDKEIKGLQLSKAKNDLKDE